MVAVLSEVLTENQKKGALSLFLSAAYEITGLLKGAVREHISLITGFTRGGKSLSRRLTMHSDFRFRKATVTLLGLILLAVSLAIQKAKDIQASIAYANPQAGPIHATQQLALFATLFLCGRPRALSACLAGLFFLSCVAPVHSGFPMLIPLTDPTRAAVSRFNRYSRSKIPAAPMPPPMHIVTMP
jgi:hypothetical protein